jgi:Pyruvate/2-oxoacid:ferredoxin oxidoreductase delta subunit
MAERGYENRDWTRAEIDDVLAEYIPVTVPVSISVEGKQKVLGFNELEKILRKAKLISLEPCWCRLKIKGCDGPIDVCVCVDKEADLAIAKREGRKATYEEAMNALRRSHKAGFVHLAYETPGHEMRSICSCCACCCHTMAAITRFGYDPAIIGHADVIAVYSSENCNQCGLCVKRCHFKAWTTDGDKVMHNPDNCAGCGVCVSSCPTGSITLNKRVLRKGRKS